MAEDSYDDLQLRIDRDADGSYRVLAMAPDGRTVRGLFTRPISDLDLDEFVQHVGLARGSGAADTRMQAIQALGSALFEALVKDEVAKVYHSARSAAAERGRGLRITLRLSGAPELMRLPWEFLYKRPRFIAQSTQTPIVRALDVDSAIRPQKLRLPLRILALVSSPSGYRELNSELERRNLEQALAEPIAAGQVELTWLERATLGELGRRIAEPDEIHVLHYIGHGAYDEATESGILVLETPQGRAHDVSGEEIGAMLQDETSLRLVVLNACQGARTSHVDPFSGVAASLVNFDIPAVIGMQFEITDVAAIEFSRSLYTGLAHGLPVDAALAPARRAIVGAMLATEFGTPVLFLRDGDARLFDIAEATRGSPLPKLTPDVGIEFDVGESSAEEPESEPRVDVSEPTPGSGPTDAEGPPNGKRSRPMGVALWVVVGLLLIGGTVTALFLALQPRESSDATMITTEVSVPSSQLWTTTSIQCVTGAPLSIRATGTVQHGPTADRTSGPDGMPGEYLSTNVVNDANHASLIGRIGEAGVPFFIGASLDTTCSSDGPIYLGINDEGYVGNIGEFLADVDHEQ